MNSIENSKLRQYLCVKNIPNFFHEGRIWMLHGKGIIPATAMPSYCTFNTGEALGYIKKNASLAESVG